MKNLSVVLKTFGLILKYSAVLLAVIKGLEVVNDELKKIDLSDGSK